jgi:hypothetical protein
MSTTTFNTLAYFNKLKESGMPEKQAEIQAEALREIIENNLATKTDLENVREKLEVNMRELEYRLIIKMGIMLTSAVLILAAIIKL